MIFILHAQGTSAYRSMGTGQELSFVSETRALLRDRERMNGQEPLQKGAANRT